MRRTSFTTASFWRFLALALVPLIAIGAFAGSEATRLQRESAGWRNTVEAAAIKAKVETFLTGPVVALTEMAHIPPDARVRTELSTSVLDHFPAIESIVLVDDSGRSVHAAIAPSIDANPDDFVGLDRSNDPLFKLTQDSAVPVWSGVFTSVQSGRRAVAVGVRGDNGVAIATINIDSLGDALANTPTQAGSVIVVTDSEGTVLFHTSSETAAKRPNWRNVDPIARSVSREFGTFEYVLDGVKELGSTVGVNGADWAVLVQTPRSVALRPVYAVWGAIASAVLAAAALAAVAAVLFSRDLSRPIAGLSEFASQVERGEDATEPSDYHFVEIAELGHSIARMAEAVAERESDLRAARDDLLENQHHLETTAAERESALARLGALTAQLTATEERERRRLAEDLHDRVSQPLAVARMRMGLVRPVRPDEGEQLTAVDALLAEAIAQTRAITTELSPPILYELGLGAAVSGLVEEMSASFGVTIHADIDVDDSRLSDEAKMALYRAAREFVANVIKHSGSDEGWVDLHGDGTDVVLCVRDEGAGIDPELAGDPTRFGLFSLRERITHLGGTICIDSHPGDGTNVCVRVPDGSRRPP